jgi:hypothetical protein
MLLSLRLICLSSASIAGSPVVCGPAADVPPGLAAEPVVVDDPDDPLVEGEPDELAVPALLVPGAGGEATLDELPAPLGSLPELLRPPALAGPDGTPLTPAVPAPAEPALGEPAALPLPADGPLAAPPAPPPLCANEPTGLATIAIAIMDVATDIFVIGSLRLPFNDSARCWFRAGTISTDHD